MSAREVTDKQLHDPPKQNCPARRETGISTNNYLNRVPTDTFRLPAIFTPFLELDLRTNYWMTDQHQERRGGADPPTELRPADSSSSH